MHPSNLQGWVIKNCVRYENPWNKNWRVFDLFPDLVKSMQNSIFLSLLSPYIDIEWFNLVLFVGIKCSWPPIERILKLSSVSDFLWFFKDFFGGYVLTWPIETHGKLGSWVQIPLWATQFFFWFFIFNIIFIIFSGHGIS